MKTRPCFKSLVKYSSLHALGMLGLSCYILAHALSLLRGFVFLIPMPFLLSPVGSITGVWLAFPITEALTSLLGAACSHRFHKNQVYECNNS